MAPLVAVVVATYHRPLRLRWLLNALTEGANAEGLRSAHPTKGSGQSREIWVAHDASDRATADVLAAFAGVRSMAVEDGRGPAAKRNAAWRASDAALIAFTDDDCRPPPGWLDALVAAAEANPGAIIQGATHPDPDELGVYHHAPHARSQQIDPVHPMGQTCNIAYPRSVLEAAGGFDESLTDAVGEDTDLVLRAQRGGARLVGAPGALTYHAVDWGLAGRLRGAGRWSGMALVAKRNPELRDLLPLGGYAWKIEHARWLLAAIGLVIRRPWLALPWAVGVSRVYGTHPRALARSATELPGRFAIDGAETVALLRGSARHRSLLL